MMLRSFASVFLLLTGVSAAAVAGAQSFDFLALRDSLAHVQDSAALRRLELTSRPARNSAPVDHVKHGLVALRLYDLTNDVGASKRATLAFESALTAHPDNGWAHFGLGLSLATSPEARPLNAGGKRGTFVLDDVARRLSGTDARSRARRAFNAALHTTPPVNRAARELASLAIAAQNQGWLSEARNALERLQFSGQAHADDAVALSKVQSALNDLDAAVVSADRALELGAPAGSAKLAAGVARLRLTGREAEGAKLYFDGIRAASEMELHAYYEDVLPIAARAEKKRWSIGGTEDRRDLLLDFWGVRAARGGVYPTDRLAEHYHRMPYVEQHFRRTGEFWAPAANELRWLSADKRSRFDDRGEIYLRHGKPDEVLRTPVPGRPMGESESWLYRMPDGSSRIFHFFRVNGGYSLPYNVPCDRDWALDRAPLDPSVGRLAVGCSPGQTTLNSADVRQLYHEALESDSHYPRFSRDLPFFYDLYTFRGQSGKTVVVAAFAVPADKLEKSHDDKGSHYRFDVSLILADTASGTISRTDDSTSVSTRRLLGGDDLLRTHLEVQVPPSLTTLQRVIVTDATAPGIGQLYGGPFPIPDYSGKQLMLSDIALGRPDTTGGWKRGQVTLALVPTSNFPGGNFSVFYEVYNLPAGRNYTTEITIERLDKGTAAKLRDLFGGGEDIDIRFAGESTAGPDATLPELRRVEAPLGKGRYRLTVTVRDTSTGQSTRRSRLFRIPG